MTSKGYIRLGILLLILMVPTTGYLIYWANNYTENKYIALNESMVEIQYRDTIRCNNGFFVEINTPSYYKDKKSGQIFKNNGDCLPPESPLFWILIVLVVIEFIGGMILITANSEPDYGGSGHCMSGWGD